MLTRAKKTQHMWFWQTKSTKGGATDELEVQPCSPSIVELEPQVELNSRSCTVPIRNKTPVELPLRLGGDQ